MTIIIYIYYIILFISFIYNKYLLLLSLLLYLFLLKEEKKKLIRNSLFLYAKVNLYNKRKKFFLETKHKLIKTTKRNNYNIVFMHVFF